MLHGFAGAHDRHATDFAFEFHSGVGPSDRCCDGVGQYWQMIEGFLDQEAVDAVAVENEVGPIGVLVADHAGTLSVYRGMNGRVAI